MMVVVVVMIVTIMIIITIVVVIGVDLLARTSLQSAPLRLGDQKSREETEEHDQGEDLHDPVDEGCCAAAGGAGSGTAGLEWGDCDLG